VREFAVPPLYEVPAGANLTDLTHANATEAPDAPVFGRKIDGVWRDVTSTAFLAEVTALAKGLVASGIEPGDRVGIHSHTRYEWTLFDFALWEAGAVPVPIYETSSREQVEWMASDSGLTALVTEDAASAAIIDAAHPNLPDLKQVWRIDQGVVAELSAAGAGVTDEEIAARRRTMTPDSLATIIYTSGTTGRPKGCVLTHGNVLAECGNAITFLRVLFNRSDGTTLLFLPLAHVLARIIEVGAFMSRSKLGHCPDVSNIVEELGSFRPTFILSVPRVFEKVYNGARQQAYAGGKGKIFDAAADTAIAWSQAREAGKVGVGLNLRHALFDRLVYAKLRAALGGQTEFAISGGGPLGVRLVHFFRGVGLFVLEGYGLTESSAAAAVNPYPKAKAGTVGPPLPGTTVRIADDGEILLKGPEVFSSYWNNEEATTEAFVDGWYRTGDLGSLDDEGYLAITGRKKEILVTAAGKNVAPTVLEDRINAHALIGQSMVVGDRQPFIAALVTLDPDSLPHWKDSHGKPADATVADLADDPDLLAEIQQAIDEANNAVSRAESIRKFKVLTDDWTVEGGQLTPSMKLKRGVVMTEHEADVTALYSAPR
jgi:long-chain acyl-CoA synthetase